MSCPGFLTLNEAMNLLLLSLCFGLDIIGSISLVGFEYIPL